MIAISEVITQDQLTASSNPSKVRVRYPRGAQTVLAVNFDAPEPGPYLADANEDGAYAQFSVLLNGNLLLQPDKPDRPAFVVLGAGLVPVTR